MDESAASKQLRRAFLKSVDASIESLRASEIRDCFQPIKGAFANSLDGAVVKQLGNLSKNAEV